MFEADKEQVGKNGTSYVFRTYELATKMETDTENEMIVELLHDVVEDIDMTLV